MISKKKYWLRKGLLRFWFDVNNLSYFMFGPNAAIPVLPRSLDWSKVGGTPQLSIFSLPGSWHHRAFSIWSIRNWPSFWLGDPIFWKMGVVASRKFGALLVIVFLLLLFRSVRNVIGHLCVFLYESIRPYKLISYKALWGNWRAFRRCVKGQPVKGLYSAFQRPFKKPLKGWPYKAL